MSTVARPPSLFGRRYLGTTTGMLLVVSVVAFESIAVATALPTAVRALEGLAWYGWPFTAFLVANVLGMVLGGQLSDRRGPRPGLLAGQAVFVAGLLLAGLAPWMSVLVAGRAVQGLGTGVLIVAIYVLIAEVYDGGARPRMLGALSAAWVLPALLGPVVAGVVAERLSWHWVFLGIVPFALLALALLWPALSRVAARTGAGPVRVLWPYALLAACGVALLQYAGQHLTWWSVLLAVGGVACLVPAVRTLLPAGSAVARRGLPAVVSMRAIAAGSFFAVDSLVPLTLSTVHGFSPTAAGLPLTVGAVGWAAASWWQGRHPAIPPYRSIRVGLVLIAAAAGTMALVAQSYSPAWPAYPAWVCGGAGMGLVAQAAAVLTLGLSPEAERGFNSAAVQIGDVTMSAICIGAGGALVAASARGALGLSAAAGTINLAMMCLALVGALLASRARATSPADS